MTTLSRIPCHLTVAPAARAAPPSPPMRAWDEDEGSPFHHVSRFHPIAPTSAAPTSQSPSMPCGRVDDPAADGLGHLGAEERADEVGDRRHHQSDARRQRPGRHRRGDGVRRVVEPVRVVEAHRQGDDDGQSEATPRVGQDSLTAMPSTVLRDALERVGGGLERRHDVLHLQHVDRVGVVVEEVRHAAGGSACRPGSRGG